MHSLLQRLAAPSRWHRPRLLLAVVLASIPMLAVGMTVVHPRTVHAASLDTSCTSASFASDVKSVTVASPGHNGTIVFKCSGPNAIDIDVRTSSGGPGTVVVSSGSSLTITSTGANVTLDGKHATQLLKVTNNGSLTLDHLTIANGAATAPSYGGGVDNEDGTVTITNSAFSGNQATGGTSFGGGLFNRGGTVTITNSTFSGNQATGGVGGFGSGGGLFNTSSVTLSGTVTITNSTFSGNQATGGVGGFGSGGGLFNDGRTVTITNSTFSGNQAAGGVGSFGGGLSYASGTTTITNSTFSGNSAGQGGGLFGKGGAATITNSIVAANSATHAPNCANSSTLTDGGYNLENSATASDCGFSTGSPKHDQLVATAADVHLGPLGNYGGLTQTIPLAAGSPAIDHASSRVCAAVPVSGVDQRGVSRTQGANCDIGAYELELPTAALDVGTTRLPSSGVTHVVGGTPLNLTGSDVGPGVGSVSYCVYAQGGSCAKFTTVNGSTTTFFLGTTRPDGAYTVAYYATDALGNHGPLQSAALTLDHTPPAVTPTNGGGAGPQAQSGATGPSGDAPSAGSPSAGSPSAGSPSAGSPSAGSPSAFPVVLLVVLVLLGAAGTGTFLYARARRATHRPHS